MEPEWERQPQKSAGPGLNARFRGRRSARPIEFAFERPVGLVPDGGAVPDLVGSFAGSREGDAPDFVAGKLLELGAARFVSTGLDGGLELLAQECGLGRLVAIDRGEARAKRFGAGAAHLHRDGIGRTQLEHRDGGPSGMAVLTASNSSPRQLREDFGAVLSNDNDLLEPDAEAAGQVDPWFDGEDVADFDGTFGRAGHIRLLVYVDAKTMPGSMRETIAVAGGGDDVACGLVDQLGGIARLHGRERRFHGAVHDCPNGVELGRRVAECADAGHVRGIALGPAADIDEDGFVAAELAVCRGVMRERAVFAEAHWMNSRRAPLAA